MTQINGFNHATDDWFATVASGLARVMESRGFTYTLLAVPKLAIRGKCSIASNMNKNDVAALLREMAGKIESLG